MSLVYTTLMVLAISAVVGQQKPPPAAWLAAAVGVIGIVLMVYSPGASFDGIGIAAALLTALAGAVGGLLSKQWKSVLPLLSFTGWQLLLGGICLMPIALLLEPPLPPLTAANIGGYLYLCLLGTVLAYILFFRGISALPVAVVLSLGLLSPVSAFILGWIFLGQSMSAPAILGFCLALLSIYGVQHALRHHK